MGGPTPSVQLGWDGPGLLSAGSDGKALCWDQATGKFTPVAKANAAHTHAPADLTQGGASNGQALVWNGSAWVPGSAGVTDHGALTGLSDDDHALYALADGSRGSFSALGHTHAYNTLTGLPTLVTAHSQLSGLAADDHALYALADKSRPATWVSAGDLAARSLADLGTRTLANLSNWPATVGASQYLRRNSGDTAYEFATLTIPTSIADLATRTHSLLTGLSADDHTQYALLAGRAGGQTLTSPVSTSGSPFVLKVNGGAHTTLAASTEATDLDIALNRTVQWATGALTTQRAVVIRPPTYGFVGASTLTTAVTLEVLGAPVAGTNATITNKYVSRFVAGVATEVPIVAKGFTSQSANLQEWQNSAGTVVARVGSGGALEITQLLTGNSANGLRMSLANGGNFDVRDGGSQTLYQCTHAAGTHIFRQFNAAQVAVTIRGFTSQVSSLTDWTDNTPTVLSSVDSAGRHLVPLGALATCGLAFLGDPNTGLYSTGADVMSLVAGGVDRLKVNATGLGFFAQAPAAQPTVTGSRGGNAALASLLTGLAALGLVIDSTSA